MRSPSRFRGPAVHRRAGDSQCAASAARRGAPITQNVSQASSRLRLQIVAEESAMKTITTHYIDGAFVESHGHEVMDIINPTNKQVIARVTLADDEDARRAIAAAKRAFTSFGRTTKEERTETLRSLRKAVSARADDLTKMM